jgi:hypothetical protein
MMNLERGNPVRQKNRVYDKYILFSARSFVSFRVVINRCNSTAQNSRAFRIILAALGLTYVVRAFEQLLPNDLVVTVTCLSVTDV